jgi:hypothetical protein
LDYRIFLLFLSTSLYIFACVDTQSSISTTIYANDQEVMNNLKDQERFEQSINPRDQTIMDQRIMITMDQLVLDQRIISGCQQKEICNFIDDDCDNQIDEDRVCGHLLAAHCELTIGWTTKNIEGIEELYHWPSLYYDPLSEGCPTLQVPQSVIGPLNTSCASSGRDQQFHPLTFYESVGEGDQLGLHFRCYGDSPNADENIFLQWVDSYCSVALAYDDENDNRSFGELGLVPQGCEKQISEVNAGEPRCIQSRSDYPRSFSILKLEATVDQEDRFGIAFSCQEGVGLFQEYATLIPKNIEIFLGFDLIAHPEPVNLNELCMPKQSMSQPSFYRCPEQEDFQEQLVSGMESYFCFGSQGNQWNEMKIEQPHPFLGLCDQLFVAILPARDR